MILKKARHLIKLFAMFHEMHRQDGNMAVYIISDKDLKTYVKSGNTKRSRAISTFNYLLKMEMANLNRRLTVCCNQLFQPVYTAIRLEEIAAQKHIAYGIGQNTIYHRLYDKDLSRIDEWNAVREFNSWGVPLGKLDAVEKTEIRTDGQTDKVISTSCFYT